MKLILIFLIIALTECKIFRYRRSSILEAACKRKPFLGFCKDGTGSRKINPSRPSPFRRQPSRPSLTRTSRPEPTRPKSSQPFPFGTSERFGGRLGGGDFDRSDRLEATGGNSNWRKISGTNRPSTVSESLGLGGGGGGGGGGGIGVGSGVGVGVPGVGPIGVNSGLGIGAPGIEPTRRKSSQPFPFGTSERFGGRLGGGDFDRSDRLEGNRATGGNSNWRKISGTNRPSTVSESLGLGGGGGGGGGGIGVGSGVGVGVPGVGPIGVNSGLGIGAPGLGGGGCLPRCNCGCCCC
uniref:Uncharacterized protein n=1 Tax=Panagrolaimus sp. PS1159 TaxID=55785 RepID=A0AC35FKM5_9BILA